MPPAELDALIARINAIVVGEFASPSNALALYEQRERILAALTQARVDREEVEWLTREMTAAAQLKDEMARLFHLACDQRDKAEAENEALAKFIPKIPEYHSAYPDDKDIARCNYDCGVTVGMLRAQMAEEATARTTAAKEGA